MCPCLLFSDLASSYLQGLLLLLFLTELELGLLDVFLKMLGTDSKLANYPHSQPLQLALLGCSSWPDPYKAATGKEALFSGTGRTLRHLLVPVSCPRRASTHTLFPLTPEVSLIPGSSEFSILATDRAIQDRKGYLMSEKIRDAVQQCSLGRNMKKGEGDVF